MSSTTHVLLDSYYSPEQSQFRDKSAKRVSFLEKDVIVVIPNDGELDKSKRYTFPRRTSRISHAANGIVKTGPTSSMRKLQSQHHPGHEKRWVTAEENICRKSTAKQVKSILKKSTCENYLQRTPMKNSFNSFNGKLGTHVRYNGEDDFQGGTSIKKRINFNPHTTVEGSEVLKTSRSNTNFPKRQSRENEGQHNEKDTFSPQGSWDSLSSTNINSSFSRSSNFSPTRKLLQKHGSLGLVRPLTSTSPEEQFRKSGINQSTPSIIRSYRSDPLGVAADSMLNVTDLYPAANNIQKHLLSDSSISREKMFGVEGVGSRGIPARELVSRSGSQSKGLFYTRQLTQSNGNYRTQNNSSLTQTNVSPRASAGLSRAAELSLLHRLRKFERTEPYVAWQACERNIYSSSSSTIAARASDSPSVFGGVGSVGNRTNSERTSNVLRNSSRQYYY